jgi:iron complex outermembrane receptor protein
MFIRLLSPKFVLSLLLFVSILFTGLAQGYSQQKVSGNISDVNGQPLIGASVVEKGTSNGTQADFDGNYTIDNVNNDGTLVFSFIGFKTQEVSINGLSSIDVVLLRGFKQAR